MISTTSSGPSKFAFPHSDPSGARRADPGNGVPWPSLAAVTAILVLLAGPTPSIAQSSPEAPVDGAVVPETGPTNPTGTADDQATRAGSAARVESPPVIDGRLDDSAWQAAESLTDFVQHEPLEGMLSTEDTEVRIVYDEEALYVGAWLRDREAGGIISGERRRDANLRESDAFIIVLDTYRDLQTGFVFGTNPGAIEYDGQVRGEGSMNTSWDGSWTVATSQDPGGWYAEFRIPFSTLRYGSDEDQEWGLNLVRYIGRKNEQVVWSPVPRQFGFYRLTEAGRLGGLRPPPRRVTTVTPYVLGAAQRIPPVDPNVTYPFEVGGDAKVGITGSLALDLTVNTDFAQVEVDDQQVDLTRYSLFFPEKRPFFLENADLFTMGLPFYPARTSGRTQLFHSRRIGVASGQQVPIEWGGRLSGRTTGLDVGLLHMRTGGLDDVQEANGWTVARVARELPSRSRLGAIFTQRRSTGASEEYNRSYGIDGRLGIGDEWTFTGVAGWTDTPSVDESREILSFVGEYLTRDWYIRTYYDQIGDNFNPEMGFVPYRGFRESSVRVERIFRTETDWMREVRTHLRRTWAHDLAGFKELDMRHWHVNFNLEDGGQFSPAVNWQLDGLSEPFPIRGTDIVVPAGTYEGWNSYGTFRTNPSATVSFNGRYDIGSFLSGDRVGGNVGVSVRRGATLTGSFSVSHNRLSFGEGDFNTTLTRVGLRYAFTPMIFVQSLVQYGDQTGEWSGNVRFGWLDTAGTGLFLVYNERQTMDVTGMSGLLPRDALVPAERTFVIKYARQIDLAHFGEMLD